MKKILYTALLAIAGLAAASCVQEHIEAVYDPSAVTAQVLGSVQGCELSEDGDPVIASFGLADFGEKRAGIYSFFASLDEGFSSPSKLGASITIADGGNVVSIAQKDLNTFILNNGGEAGTPFTLYFRLVSYLANDKGTAIESTAINSNVVKADFVPYDADLRDSDKYPVSYLPGGYQAKGPGKSGWVFTDEQYLFDYAGDGNYTGIIDFYESGAAGKDYGFKLTLDPTWDNGDFGDNPDTPAESETGTVNLKRKPADPDNGNVLCFDTYRFYMFSFNPQAQTLTKKYAFHNVGIVGAFNGWDAADQNMKMTYNTYYHRFYIDHTFDSDTELKFTCDDKWDLNWGVDCKPGGDNIAVTAGSYRVYLDLNKSKIEFSAKMFGQVEPGAPEPEPEPEPTYKGWGITGSIASAGIEWDGDIAMTEDAGVWTGYATLATSDQFKFRKDAAWEENFGGPGDNEPYVIADGAAFEAVTGGKNMAVPADGFYKVVLNTNDKTITVSSTTVWGAIGDFNSWSSDSFLTGKDGKWISSSISLKAGEGFKIRKNSSWDENRGAKGDTEPYTVGNGVPVEVQHNGKNLAVAADGDYILTYDPAAETITVNPALPQNSWSLIGMISGSSWDKDFYMTESNGMWVSDAVELKAGDGFKVRYNNDWGVNRGAADGTEPVGLGKGESLNVVNDGKNLAAKEDGTYVVVYDPEEELIYFLGWSVIGQVNGSNWDSDIPMYPAKDSEDGKLYWTSPVFSAEGGFKIRYEGGWDVNRGADGSEDPYIITSSVPFKAVHNGKNLGVKAEEGTYYKVVYNATDDELAVINCSWSVVGQVNGSNWDKDVLMICFDGKWLSTVFSIEGEFKIRFNHGWDTNRGAKGSAACTVTLGTPVEVEHNGQNLKVDDPSGTYMLTYDPATESIAVVKGTIGTGN